LPAGRRPLRLLLRGPATDSGTRRRRARLDGLRATGRPDGGPSGGPCWTRQGTRNARGQTMAASVCRGVLITHNGPLTAVFAAGPGALLAGLPAARESGLRFGEAGPIHILVPSSHGYPDLRRRLPLDLPGVVVHRSSLLPDDHVQVGRPTRTTLPRSLLDAAQWARTDDTARAMVAAGFQQRHHAPRDSRGRRADAAGEAPFAGS
jgi:hypothetical protein